MDRRVLGYALLFSVPPGVGLVGFLTVLLGDGPVNPMAAAVGGAVAFVLFLLIVVGASRGSTELDEEVAADDVGRVDND